MTGFWQSWNLQLDFRNTILLSYSVMSFVLINGLLGNSKIENFAIECLFLFARIAFVAIFSFCSVELISNAKTIESGIYPACISIFGFSIILAAIIRDVNIIVAGVTLLLVIITAFSVKKSSESIKITNEIAQKQLKLQNNPIISLSIKENDEDVRFIDLIIENVGNGVAKNVEFEICPHGFITLSGDPLERLYFFQRGIQLIPPNQKYIIHLVNFAQKIQGIRDRENFPLDDLLSPSEAQRFRRIVRSESELRFIVHFENNEGEQSLTRFDFNLCIFWGLRFPARRIG